MDWVKARIGKRRIERPRCCLAGASGKPMRLALPPYFIFLNALIMWHLSTVPRASFARNCIGPIRATVAFFEVSLLTPSIHLLFFCNFLRCHIIACGGSLTGFPIPEQHPFGYFWTPTKKAGSFPGYYANMLRQIVKMKPSIYNPGQRW